MPIKLPNGKIARTIAEQVYKNMQDIAFLMNKKDFQILVVDELPEEGSENTLYLVPSDDPEQDNVYTEYIWTGTAFEMVGTTAIDISNMVTTDTNQNIIGEKVFEAPVTFYDNITLTVDAAFEGDMLPKSTDSYDIGSSTYYWKDAYIGGSIRLKGSTTLIKMSFENDWAVKFQKSNDNGSTWSPMAYFSGSEFYTRDLYPMGSGSYNLGHTTYYWKNLYLNGSINFAKSGETTTYTLAEQTGGSLLLSRSGTGIMSFASTYFSTYNHRPIANNTYDLGSASFAWKDAYISGYLKDGLGNDATLEELVGIGKAMTGTLQPNTVTLADGDTLTDAPTIYMMSRHLPIKVNGLMFYFICEANNKYCYFSYAIDASNNYTPKRLFIDKTTYVVGYHTIQYNKKVLLNTAASKGRAL